MKKIYEFYQGDEVPEMLLEWLREKGLVNDNTFPRINEGIQIIVEVIEK